MTLKWNKKTKKNKVAGIPNNHHKLPVGQVVSQTVQMPIRGEHLAIPLFGWSAVRDQTEDPLVMVTALLLDKEFHPVGTFTLELPVFAESLDATVAYLETIGWDGRVWPIDEGWPTGSGEDATQIVGLMDQAGLRATMTFPPKPEGAACMKVDVQRAQGPFLMPPLEKPTGEVDAAKKARLENMCANPRQFAAPLAPAQAEEEGERPVRIQDSN